MQTSLSNARHCPITHLPPDLEIDRRNDWPYTLVSPRGGGCMAIGQTIEKAIEHWNIFVDGVRNKPSELKNPLATTKEDAIFRALHDLHKEEG